MAEEIETIDPFFDKKSEWYAAMRAKGHEPIMNEYGLDTFALNQGFHNGPGCSKCHWACCYHCDSPADIPDCIKSH